MSIISECLPRARHCLVILSLFATLKEGSSGTQSSSN